MPVLNLAGISHFTLKNIKPNELNSIKNYIYMFNIQIKYRRIYAYMRAIIYLFAKSCIEIYDQYLSETELKVNAWLYCIFTSKF